MKMVHVMAIMDNTAMATWTLEKHTSLYITIFPMSHVQNHNRIINPSCPKIRLIDQLSKIMRYHRKNTLGSVIMVQLTDLKHNENAMSHYPLKMA